MDDQRDYAILNPWYNELCVLIKEGGEGEASNFYRTVFSKKNDSDFLRHARAHICTRLTHDFTLQPEQVAADNWTPRNHINAYATSICNAQYFFRNKDRLSQAAA